MLWACGPAKSCQDVIVKAALDGQIAHQRSPGGHVGPRPFDMSDNCRQACCRGIALADLDGRTRESELDDFGAAFREADMAHPSAPGDQGTRKAEPGTSRR